MNCIKVNCSLYFIFIILSFCITACKIENEIPNDEILGYNYFPMDVGVYAEYEVQETRYTLTDEPEVSDYQIRKLSREVLQILKDYRLLLWSVRGEKIQMIFGN